ncbi:unnamed protein product [Larinioides sclopetarius]|uniref:Translocon-associated protein subunit delta n=1 Tax=Larinioides sclopetarius TaxID=280406 RepID=A0AAV2BQS5_9ARAC
MEWSFQMLPLLQNFLYHAILEKKDYILFADKKGRQIPALRSADNTKYQISWTESADSLFSGEHGVNVYDEEGYAAVKKAQRNNEDSSGIPSAFFLSLYHRVCSF